MSTLIGKAYVMDAPAPVAGDNPAPAPDTVYTCPHCGKAYKTEKGLTDHLAKEHPEGETPKE